MPLAKRRDRRWRISFLEKFTMSMIVDTASGWAWFQAFFLALAWHRFFISNVFESRIWLACLPKHLPRKLCGVGFGRNLPKRLRKRMSSVVDRLYEGDPVVDIPPPPERELRYRLPCSWKRNKNFSVGGVLYVGPMGLLFVPHKMNLPRDHSVFEMGPNKSLRLCLAPQTVSRLFKVLVPRPSPALEVIWPEGSAQFLVPAPNHVLKSLDERVREMA